MSHPSGDLSNIGEPMPIQEAFTEAPTEKKKRNLHYSETKKFPNIAQGSVLKFTGGVMRPIPISVKSSKKSS